MEYGDIECEIILERGELGRVRIRDKERFNTFMLKFWQKSNVQIGEIDIFFSS